MPQVPFTSFYLGPLAVYPANTGLQDPITGAPQKGGNFFQGDYCDLSTADAQVWNSTYGTNLFPGRYRIVSLSKNATAANVVKGKPVALSLGTAVAEVSISGAGTGQTPGNYTAQASSGTASISYVIGSAGTLISATVTAGGSYPTGTIPTFTIAAGGTPGTVVTHMNVNVNVITSWDASAVSLLNDARGVFLAPVTAAQITAGAWIIIQELGIAEILVTLATTGTPGATAFVSGSGGTITTSTKALAASTAGAVTLGSIIDTAVAATLTRVDLALPVRQG